MLMERDRLFEVIHSEREVTVLQSTVSAAHPTGHGASRTELRPAA